MTLGFVNCVILTVVYVNKSLLNLSCTQLGDFSIMNFCLNVRINLKHQELIIIPESLNVFFSLFTVQLFNHTGFLIELINLFELPINTRNTDIEKLDLAKKNFLKSSKG